MHLELTREPDVTRGLFSGLVDGRSVARLLEVTYPTLVYHLFRVPEHRRYKEFWLRKRTGGLRRIESPQTHLKILQQKLSAVLALVYEPRRCVHGFVKGKSIVTNAERHTGKEWVLSVDLHDFFPSINFGRVRGLFMAKPYSLPDPAATVLARICCHDNRLPQGAPTSPVVSNMICAPLDRELMTLAATRNLHYTRYADDLTFSSRQLEFPDDVACPVSIGLEVRIGLGLELERIIQGNGFRVAEKKIKLQGKHQRQEVTGLTVNEKVNVPRGYVRQIRAMLRAWRNFRLEEAEEEFRKRWDVRNANPLFPEKSFLEVVAGKIGFLEMVRGSNDSIVSRFWLEYERLRERDRPELAGAGSPPSG